MLYKANSINSITSSFENQLIKRSRSACTIAVFHVNCKIQNKNLSLIVVLFHICLGPTILIDNNNELYKIYVCIGVLNLLRLFNVSGSNSQ